MQVLRAGGPDKGGGLRVRQAKRQRDQRRDVPNGVRGVERGWDMVGKLRELADEGKLRLEITHVPSVRVRHGVTIRGIAKTVISWSAKGE